MNKTDIALNIIAIGIFILTLSCLLGPILNISPTIPAVVTFSIMGLATIDTLSWQNRGATLFLDVFSSREHRKRIVHHEAGHFLAAYILGIPITGYTLTAWEAFRQGQPGLGGVTFDLDAVTSEYEANKNIGLVIDRFCTVWMAGSAAEKLLYGNIEGGEEDRQKVRETLLEVGVAESILQQKERWAQLQATNLIENNREAYDALVIAMSQRLSVSECCEIIQ